MTIEYKDSKRISALSSDFTTPIVWQNMTDGQSASGNVLSKSGANWTADATSTATFSSSVGAKVEFTVSANTSDSFCGFDISTNTDSYDMDYALYCGGGGTINIYANGSQVTTTSETYSTTDTLAVNMDSSGTVTFLKNGSVFYTSLTTASGTYRVNAVIYTSGVSLTANYITDKPTDVQDNSILVEKDNAKRYWFSAPTPALFDENFANALAWTQTGSDITIASNQLTWIGDRQNTSNGLHHDMGANVVNTSAWTLEFDLILDNYSAGTASNTHQLGVMMTNVHSGVGSLGSNATRDFIGMSLNWRTDTASQQRKFYAKDDNGSTDTWSDNSPANTPDDSTSQGFPTAGTTYHIKIIRTNATAYKIEIWNSDESSLLDTLNGACSNTSDLRYILVQKYGDSADGNPSFDGKIDNMKFYNSAVAPATWTWEKEDIRGLFMGGATSSASNVIDYITIATTGNATPFGDLVVATYDLGACSSHSRGVYGGGNTGSMTNNMGYVTIATAGNATDFGNLTVVRGEAVPTASNRTRGIWAGGWNGSANVSTIDYVTIDTTGDASGFGDLSAARRAHAGSGNSGTRGIFAGGYSSSFVNTIDYVTISSLPTVTATTFGTLSSGRGQLTGLSNTTRTLFAGGGSYGDVIDFYVNDTGGAATDFGNLTASLDQVGTCSSTTRGVMGGGSTGSNSNIIQYVTIAVPSAIATDFGDLTVARGQQCNGASGK